jgi:hypothetical protein
MLSTKKFPEVKKNHLGAFENDFNGQITRMGEILVMVAMTDGATNDKSERRAPRPRHSLIYVTNNRRQECYDKLI